MKRIFLTVALAVAFLAAQMPASASTKKHHKHHSKKPAATKTVKK